MRSDSGDGQRNLCLVTSFQARRIALPRADI